MALEEADREEEEEREGEGLSSSSVSASPSSPSSSSKLVHLRVCLCPSAADAADAPEYELQDAHDALVFWDAIRSLGGGGGGSGKRGSESKRSGRASSSAASSSVSTASSASDSQPSASLIPLHPLSPSPLPKHRRWPRAVLRRGPLEKQGARFPSPFAGRFAVLVPRKLLLLPGAGAAFPSTALALGLRTRVRPAEKSDDESDDEEDEEEEEDAKEKEKKQQQKKQQWGGEKEPSTSTPPALSAAPSPPPLNTRVLLLDVGGRTWALRAEDGREAAAWLEALKRACKWGCVVGGGALSSSSSLSFASALPHSSFFVAFLFFCPLRFAVDAVAPGSFDRFSSLCFSCRRCRRGGIGGFFFLFFFFAATSFLSLRLSFSFLLCSSLREALPSAADDECRRGPREVSERLRRLQRGSGGGGERRRKGSIGRGRSSSSSSSSSAGSRSRCCCSGGPSDCCRFAAGNS